MSPFDFLMDLVKIHFTHEVAEIESENAF